MAVTSGKLMLPAFLLPCRWRRRPGFSMMVDSRVQGALVSKNEIQKSSWIRRRVEGAITGGLDRAYKTVKVDPQNFLQELRLGCELPVRSIQEMRLLPREVLNDLADQTIA